MSRSFSDSYCYSYDFSPSEGLLGEHGVSLSILRLVVVRSLRLAFLGFRGRAEWFSSARNYSSSDIADGVMGPEHARTSP